MSKFDPAAGSKRWLLFVVVIALLAWLALWGLIQLPITGATRALFFVLLFGALTNTIMPPIAYLNARFGRCRDRQTYQGRFVRQSIWVGLLVAVLAWLQMRRILTFTLAMLLSAVFVLTETFILTRERPTGDS